MDYPWWSHRELNPDLILAKDTLSRSTMAPDFLSIIPFLTYIWNKFLLTRLEMKSRIEGLTWLELIETCQAGVTGKIKRKALVIVTCGYISC